MATCLAIAPLRFAAWFLGMTHLLAALSSFLPARLTALPAASLSPAVMAVLTERMAVFSSLLTALLRSWAF